MKRLLLVFWPFSPLVFFGCKANQLNDPPSIKFQSPEIGRYQMVYGSYQVFTKKYSSEERSLFKIDTVTGKTWILESAPREKGNGTERFWYGLED